ncbi:hypothetical protein N7516_010689 [Penicillium verrucosum]|uniref:uncharacterized protein n=1 Tax=Penicillium verrucosum TaxID=60171 RepID=UPI00254572BA|nr:uncharacterized protein N7516_010689 [Penicillium verrucosum]KAJ5922986.1 hypothetical protein N7516_010689 [Penicillium verrucosum]
MENPETAKFLCGLEGKDVTLDPPSEPPLHLPRQTWLKKYGYLPRMSTMSKIIYDKATGVMYAISVVD